MRGQLWLLQEFGLSHSYCSGVVKPLKMKPKKMPVSCLHPSIHLSICWPFPAVSVVRVSVYLPWRPADVYCDGIEYSSYQYGPHQCWISHSGLAGCPPAAYSNIVSRIVNIGAELRPCSPGATEDSQIRKNIFSSICPLKNCIFLCGRGTTKRREGGDGVRGVPASP